MSDLIEGLCPKEKHENAPDFVIVPCDYYEDWVAIGRTIFALKANRENVRVSNMGDKE